MMKVYVTMFLSVLVTFGSEGREREEFVFLPKTPRTDAASTIQIPPESQVIIGSFKPYFDNLRCDAPKRTFDSAPNMNECKERCRVDVGCNYYAYWPKRRYCETYEHCLTGSPDGTNRIFVYKRMTECDAVRKMYVLEISMAFPDNSVRGEGENQNMYCSCTTKTWMVCGIFVEPNSEEEKIIKSRLNRDDEKALEPFHILQSPLGTKPGKNFPITFSSNDIEVFAEMQITNPRRCLDVQQCVEGTPPNELPPPRKPDEMKDRSLTQAGTCPVARSTFLPGDVVYIINKDVQLASQGKAVPCITMTGLRTWSLANDGEEFQDPLLRENGRDDFLVRKDYSIFFALNDHLFAKEFCLHPDSSPSKRKRRKKKGKSMEGGEPSSGELPEPGSGEIPEPSSSELFHRTVSGESLDADEPRSTPTNWPTKSPSMNHPISSSSSSSASLGGDIRPASFGPSSSEAGPSSSPPGLRIERPPTNEVFGDWDTVMTRKEINDMKRRQKAAQEQQDLLERRKRETLEKTRDEKLQRQRLELQERRRKEQDILKSEEQERQRQAQSEPEPSNSESMPRTKSRRGRKKHGKSPIDNGNNSETGAMIHPEGSMRIMRFVPTKAPTITQSKSDLHFWPAVPAGADVEAGHVLPTDSDSGMPLKSLQSSSVRDQPDISDTQTRSESPVHPAAAVHPQPPAGETGYLDASNLPPADSSETVDAVSTDDEKAQWRLRRKQARSKKGIPKDFLSEGDQKARETPTPTWTPSMKPSKALSPQVQDMFDKLSSAPRPPMPDQPPGFPDQLSQVQSASDAGGSELPMPPASASPTIESAPQKKVRPPMQDASFQVDMDLDPEVANPPELPNRTEDPMDDTNAGLETIVHPPPSADIYVSPAQSSNNIQPERESLKPDTMGPAVQEAAQPLEAAEYLDSFDRQTLNSADMQRQSEPLKPDETEPVIQKAAGPSEAPGNSSPGELDSDDYSARQTRNPADWHMAPSRKGKKKDSEPPHSSAESDGFSEGSKKRSRRKSKSKSKQVPDTSNDGSKPVQLPSGPALPPSNVYKPQPRLPFDNAFGALSDSQISPEQSDDHATPQGSGATSPNTPRKLPIQHHAAELSAQTKESDLKPKQDSIHDQELLDASSKLSISTKPAGEQPPKLDQEMTRSKPTHHPTIAPVSIPRPETPREELPNLQIRPAQQLSRPSKDIQTWRKYEWVPEDQSEEHVEANASTALMSWQVLLLSLTSLCGIVQLRGRQRSDKEVHLLFEEQSFSSA